MTEENRFWSHLENVWTTVVWVRPSPMHCVQETIKHDESVTPGEVDQYHENGIFQEDEELYSQVLFLD